MELEPATNFVPVVDRRPRLPEPLGVRLIAVEDVRLPTPPAVHQELDEFYGGFLGLEREGALSYRADNARLRFQVHDPPVQHTSLRALQVEVPSLAKAEQTLIDREADYTRQRGLTPGAESLVLLDPAGNWIELTEAREVR